MPFDSPFQNGMKPGNRGFFLPPLLLKEMASIQTLTGDTNELECLKANLCTLILVQTGVKIYIANTEQ